MFQAPGFKLCYQFGHCYVWYYMFDIITITMSALSSFNVSYISSSNVSSIVHPPPILAQSSSNVLSAPSFSNVTSILRQYLLHHPLTSPPSFSNVTSILLQCQLHSLLFQCHLHPLMFNVSSIFFQCQLHLLPMLAPSSSSFSSIFFQCQLHPPPISTLPSSSNVNSISSSNISLILLQYISSIFFQCQLHIPHKYQLHPLRM